MQRKLVKQGINQVTLCLPIKWVRSKGLKAGSEVEIEEVEDKLLIGSKNKGTGKIKELNFHEAPKNLLRSAIASAYKNGYDEIRIVTKVEISLSEINSIVNTFTGLEVVSSSQKQIIIKSFFSTTEEEIEKLIVKLFQIINLIVQNIKSSSFNQNEMENLVQVNLRKLRDHLLRAISVHRYGGEKSYDYYDLITILEKIGAELYLLGTELNKGKDKSSLKKIVPLLDLIEESYHTYLKKEFSSADDFWLRVGKEKNKDLKFELAEHRYYLINLIRHLSSRIISLNS
ncbi:MAG: hypothetical protein WCV90_01340 [Candidatus Woesearchaeota archaeon]|jgi:hypothetical protein